MYKPRTFKEYLGISARGIAMGAADVVPGVSGGTIAFISGIYEELINSIRAIKPATFQILRRQGFGAFWKEINGSFLVALISGILISIISLAKAILFLIENYPVLVWAFFFGLVLASALVISTKIKKWNFPVLLAVFFGTAIAYVITIISPAETPTALWFIFLSGAIAICAMILPGISGSFILLLMGKYEYILTSLKDIKVAIILTFAAGCISGLLGFSHVLSWMFRKYHDLTIALLTGFMIGSLNKVWPWKKPDTVVVVDGKEKIINEINLMPADYADATNLPPYTWQAVAVFIAGFVILYIIERLAVAKEKV